MAFKLSLPSIPLVRMKDRKFLLSNTNEYEFSSDSYYVFKRDKIKGYILEYTTRTDNIKRFKYLYCGKVLHPTSGKLVRLYKERDIKGHLGYIDMDVKGLYESESETKTYGATVEGFVLIHKDKYFLYDGNSDFYFIEEGSDIKHYLKKQSNITGWGQITRFNPEFSTIKVEYDIKEISW